MRLSNAALRALEPRQLAAYFDWLRADALPVGVFDGRAWSFDLPFVATLSRVWQGKIFVGATAVNRICGLQLVRGTLTLEDQIVALCYPHLGLVDELKPLGRGRWLGRLEIHRRVIWFTLEAHAT